MVWGREWERERMTKVRGGNVMCCVAATEGHSRRCGLSGIHRVHCVWQYCGREIYYVIMLRTYICIILWPDEEMRAEERYTGYSLRRRSAHATRRISGTEVFFFFFTKLSGRKKKQCVIRTRTFFRKSVVKWTTTGLVWTTTPKTHWANALHRFRAE